jgi:hypothetical protein
MIERYDAMNQKHFGGSLPAVHLKIGRLSSPRASLGQYHTIGDHGIRSEIVIDERIFTGKSRHVAWDGDWHEGISRLLNDVLLHQMAHLSTDLKFGADACGPTAHGTDFAEICSGLNKKLGLWSGSTSPFASRDGITAVETGTWWPLNIRGRSYY